MVLPWFLAQALGGFSYQSLWYCCFQRLNPNNFNKLFHSAEGVAMEMNRANISENPTKEHYIRGERENLRK